VEICVGILGFILGPVQYPASRSGGREVAFLYESIWKSILGRRHNCDNVRKLCCISTVGDKTQELGITCPWRQSCQPHLSKY
jgi:hypothetical protein